MKRFSLPVLAALCCAFSGATICAQSGPVPASVPPAQQESGPAGSASGPAGSAAPSLPPLALPQEPSVPKPAPELSAMPAFPNVPPRQPLPSMPDFPIELRNRVDASLVPDGPNPTEEATQALGARLRYREAKLKAMADPALQAALSASQKAGSDRELRESSRRYYGLFFARMRKLDPSLEKLISEREAEALKPLREMPDSGTRAAGSSQTGSIR